MSRGKKESYGELTRRIREEKEYGLREFAKLVGVSATYVSQVERGELPPPAEERVVKTAELLGLDKDELLALAGRVAFRSRRDHPREAKGRRRFIEAREKNVCGGTRSIKQATEQEREEIELGPGHRRIRGRRMQVPFKSADEIEAEAPTTAQWYAHEKRQVITPPVPIEKLIIVLGLHQEIHDLYKFLGVDQPNSGDLLGALCFATRTIHVHQGIDPEDCPWLEGRFNFTLGHEVGHWVLHRDEFIARTQQQSLFASAAAQAVICRRSEKTLPIEVQANRFASCLLLPRALVTKEWHDRLSTGTMTSPGSKTENPVHRRAVSHLNPGDWISARGTRLYWSTARTRSVALTTRLIAKTLRSSRV